MSGWEPAATQYSGRDETELERWDRNFTELLQELRVAQTGVQILFAFLLTLPFTNRFTQATETDRGVYVGTLVAAAAATALLIAPVSYHRLVFRKGRKPQLVQTGSTLAMLGLGCLLLAMLGAVFVVVDVVLHQPCCRSSAGVRRPGHQDPELPHGPGG